MRKEMMNQARQLSEPFDYFRALDWKEEILPREIDSEFVSSQKIVRHKKSHQIS